MCRPRTCRAGCSPSPSTTRHVRHRRDPRSTTVAIRGTTCGSRSRVGRIRWCCVPRFEVPHQYEPLSDRETVRSGRATAQPRGGCTASASWARPRRQPKRRSAGQRCRLKSSPSRSGRAQRAAASPTPPSIGHSPTAPSCTHILRPTWHFVLPADIRWLLASALLECTPNASYYRKGGASTAASLPEARPHSPGH